MFTGLENGGNLYSITVNPATVAADGTSLTVVVPTEATTGTVRLARDVGGILLQIVPTVTHLDINASPQLTGSGFAEGLTTLNFGAAKLVDITRDSNGLDVFNTNHCVEFHPAERRRGRTVLGDDAGRHQRGLWH